MDKFKPWNSLKLSYRYIISFNNFEVYVIYLETKKLFIYVIKFIFYHLLKVPTICVTWFIKKCNDNKLRILFV